MKERTKRFITVSGSMITALSMALALLAFVTISSLAATDTGMPSMSDIIPGEDGTSAISLPEGGNVDSDVLTPDDSTRTPSMTNETPTTTRPATTTARPSTTHIPRRYRHRYARGRRRQHPRRDHRGDRRRGDHSCGYCADPEEEEIRVDSGQNFASQN